MNRNSNSAIFFILSLFFSLFATAQTKTAVKATVDRSMILIGEPIRLTLEADIPESQPIRFFQVDSIPHFEFLEKAKIDTVNTSNGTVMSQQFRITSFDSGHWVIPSFILADNVSTDTIPVDVNFSPSPFDANQPYHDIKDIIEVNPEEEKPKQNWWQWIAAGAALLAALLYFIFRKKKKPVVQVVAAPPDPYKIAIEALANLKKDKIDRKEYYSRLVDIFRMYVSAKKGIHSMQKTTDDLAVQLKTVNIPKDLFERLSQSLRLSDFVKFAKFEPTPEDDKSSFEVIKQAVDHIEQMN
jgi:LPXTG-motif cell wall-anchored protein